MKPTWLRVNPSIRSFILGEVERQYHPIGTLEYKIRVEWMTDAWIWALEREHRRPTVADALLLAASVEPEVNQDGFRRCDVWVGDRKGIDPELVLSAVERLWEMIDYVAPMQGRATATTVMTARESDLDWRLTADDFYLEFERIHPFGDGNGRTGKIIHNWLLGRLDDPVLIYDYYRGGNP